MAAAKGDRTTALGPVVALTRIYIAGHTGLVGSALVRRFSGRRNVEVVTVPRAQLDLTDSDAVERFLLAKRPEIVILAAGKVGGIFANASFPADFLYENLLIEVNVIHAAWKAGVRRLLNFGSSCMYPRECPQPMHPGHLMTGRMEPTSEPYAMAKWAGLSLCCAFNRQYGTRFLTAIPCTVYGPGDSFDPHNAHVISALMGKFHEAKERRSSSVTLWGSGQPKREFIFVEDLAEACEFLLSLEEVPNPINVGTGSSFSIREIGQICAEVVGFHGAIHWDTSKPDGAPEKLLDSRPLRRLGWQPRTDLRSGLELTYRWFLEEVVKFRRAFAKPVQENTTCASS